MEYKIKTDILSDDRILQEVTQEHEGIETKMLRQVFDTTDKQAQAALVKLGWIRPEDKERIRKILGTYAHVDTDAYDMYMKLLK